MTTKSVLETEYEMMLGDPLAIINNGDDDGVLHQASSSNSKMEENLTNNDSIERKFSKFIYLTLMSVDEETSKTIRNDITKLFRKYTERIKI